MSKYNLYLTKRPNITTTIAGKLITFGDMGGGIFGYSTDNKAEIEGLNAEVEAGGVIYVDENVRTIDRKVEFTRKKGSGLGSVKIGPASTIKTQTGTDSQVVSQEAEKVNLATTLTGAAASPDQLGQAVSLKEKLANTQK
mgnify:CR=1 FL=1